MAGLRNKEVFKKYPEYSDAIIALNAQSSFSIIGNDYSTFNWMNDLVKKPTEEEIKSKLTELIAEWEATNYRWERYRQYSTVEEQLAQLWDDMNAGIIPGKETSVWFQQIKEVKDNTPKPTT